MYISAFQTAVSIFVIEWGKLAVLTACISKIGHISKDSVKNMHSLQSLMKYTISPGTNKLLCRQVYVPNSQLIQIMPLLLNKGEEQTTT